MSKLLNRKIIGKQNVYDIKTMKNHNFFANNILVHNCGEQPLLPFMACNLSSINVHKFCKDNGEYDYEALYSVAYTVTRLMDNLIDVMDFPDERFKINVLKYRPIGVGLMGLSDALYEMGLPYDSKEGQLFAGKIMKTLTTACIDCSADLANEKGAFDSYDVVKDDVYEVVSSLIDDPDVLEKVKKYGLRNCQHTTVAPTGCLKDGTLVSSSYGVRRIEEFGKILNETNRGPITKSDFALFILKSILTKDIQIL